MTTTARTVRMLLRLPPRRVCRYGLRTLSDSFRLDLHASGTSESSVGPSLSWAAAIRVLASKLPHICKVASQLAKKGRACGRQPRQSGKSGWQLHAWPAHVMTFARPSAASWAMSTQARFPA